MRLLLLDTTISSGPGTPGAFATTRALFMTVWRSSGCNAENGYGIRRDRSVRQRVQKSHDSPSRYKGYLKSALVWAIRLKTTHTQEC